MPKTNLYERPGPEGQDSDRRLEVGWQADSVQVATTKLRPGADRNADYLSAVTYASSTGGPPRAWEGEFISLDREQINQLIRTLREARDKAFGRNE